MIPELDLEVSEQHQDLYRSHKKVADILHTLKVLAKIDPEVEMQTLLNEHPSTAVSIAMTVAENTARIYDVLQAADLADKTKDILSLENIALATTVGMILRSISQEADLKQQFEALTSAMFQATNPTSEDILH